MTEENIFTMDTSGIKFGNGCTDEVGKKELRMLFEESFELW